MSPASDERRSIAERLPVLGRVVASWRRRGRQLHGVDWRVERLLAEQRALRTSIDRLRAANARFRFDRYAYLADEPFDHNLTRRLREAGVRFAFLDRAVTNHYLTARTSRVREIREDLVARFGYADAR